MTDAGGPAHTHTCACAYTHTHTVVSLYQGTCHHIPEDHNLE